MIIHIDSRGKDKSWVATVRGIEQLFAEAEDPKKAGDLLKIQLLHWAGEKMSHGDLPPFNSLCFAVHVYEDLPEVKDDRQSPQED